MEIQIILAQCARTDWPDNPVILSLLALYIFYQLTEPISVCLVRLKNSIPDAWIQIANIAVAGIQVANIAVAGIQVAI